MSKELHIEIHKAEGEELTREDIVNKENVQKVAEWLRDLCEGTDEH